MKYLAIIIGVILLSVGCLSNDASKRQAAWYKKFENKPLTEKEKNYVKLLEVRGYSKIDIQPPTIGVDPGGSFYSVTMHAPIRYTGENLDSIKNINHEIAKELYKNVIEDSILIDFAWIDITLVVKNGFEGESEKKFYSSYSKQQLELQLLRDN